MANYFFYEGQDILFRFDIKNGTDKIDISNYKFLAIVKGANGFECTFATANTELSGYGLINISTTDGSFQLTATQTTKMQAGKMIIEIKQADANNYKTIYKEERVILETSITKNITL